MIALRLAGCKRATIILLMDIQQSATDGQTMVMVASRGRVEMLLEGSC
ncbi:hypothetical protein SAMN05660971_01562 [Halomonas cupida]|uniref:Uncharacterized protein n=1 Tax=Halomonas cupida TaxID=44933 RepID=A0A1M7E0K1_9GAMM|nr:hypothetical protein SAMN05660971_01562 [Halomonas cupida]